jgi:hypothetical protein
MDSELSFSMRQKQNMYAIVVRKALGKYAQWKAWEDNIMGDET